MAVVFLIVAVLYWTGHFIPAGVHVKHGIVSVILARFILRERLSRIQATGVVCALAGVAFIASYADAPV